MKLYFLRHGLADHPDWHGPDAERPLTKEGQKIMKAQSRRLALFGLQPDLILHSPLVRCRQTAEIIARELKAGNRVRAEARLSPGFDFAGLIQLLVENEQVDELMLVGHAPDCGAVAGKLIGGGALKFGKGSLACVKLDRLGPRPSGTLHWLVSDDLLTAD